MNFELTDELAAILDGEKNEMRDFYITLGQSSSSKGVMFVLYTLNKKCISHHVNPETYLGQLANNLPDAVHAARKKIKNYRIDVDSEETFADRKLTNVLGIGKYKGKTIEEIFDVDHKYIFWLSSKVNQGEFKKLNKKLTNALNEYHAISKEMIVTENKAKSNPALPIDTELVERTLTCYRLIPPNDYDFYEAITHRFKDEAGNTYQYKGTRKLAELNETISLKCNWESLGITFNKINLR